MNPIDNCNQSANHKESNSHAHLWSDRTIEVIWEKAKGALTVPGLATDTKERKLPHYFTVFRRSDSRRHVHLEDGKKGAR